MAKTEPTSRRQFMQTAAAIATTAGVAQLTAANQDKPANTNSRLGVGFIGAGGRANSHMNMLQYVRDKDNEAVDLVAVCDTYRPRMQKAAARYKIPAQYDDHRKLLEDPKVDVVCIATPDHQHGYQVIDAVRAGKDVYCEKPVTHWRQFDLVKKMAAEVNKTGRVFQLGTQAMSDGAWPQMKKLVQDGAIGQPLFGETAFFRLGDWGERGMPVDDPNAKPGKDLNWEAFLGDSPKREFDVSRYFRWRMYDDYAGGPATDLYPHCLTQVIDILGVTFPDTVAGSGGIHRYTDAPREVPDTCNLLTEYPEKISITLLGTQANDYKMLTSRGSGNTAPVIRGHDASLYIEPSNRRIVIQPVNRRKPTEVPIEYPQDNRIYWQKLLANCRAANPNTLSPADLAYHVQTALIMASMSMRQKKTAHFDRKQERIVI